MKRQRGEVLLNFVSPSSAHDKPGLSYSRVRFQPDGCVKTWAKFSICSNLYTDPKPKHLTQPCLPAWHDWLVGVRIPAMDAMGGMGWGSAANGYQVGVDTITEPPAPKWQANPHNGHHSAAALPKLFAVVCKLSIIQKPSPYIEQKIIRWT